MTNMINKNKCRQGAYTTYPISAHHQVWGIGGLRIFCCSLGGLWAGGGNLRVERETNKDMAKQTRKWGAEAPVGASLPSKHWDMATTMLNLPLQLATV